MTGHDRLGALDERSPAARASPGRRPTPPAEIHRDLDRREVVAADEHAGPRDHDGHAVDGVAVGRDGARARARRRAAARPGPAATGRPASASGRGRIDVVLVVESRSSPLRVARLGPEPVRGALARSPSDASGNASRAEQVVPVAVGGEQPGHGEARPARARRQRSSSSGSTGESIRNALVAGRGRRCRSSARTR